MFKHKLLIAEPMLIDPVFSGKVVLISHYDPTTGAEGFILNGPTVGKVGYGEGNKPEDIPATKAQVIDAMEEGKLNAVELHFGGPCKGAGFYMIHGYTDLAEEKEGEFEFGSLLMENKKDDSNVIIEGVYFGTPNDMAKIALSPRLKEGKFKFLAGSAGWSAGQLEREVEAGAWKVVDATAEIVWDQKAIEALVQPPNQTPKPPKQTQAAFLEPQYSSPLFALLKPSLN